MERKFPEYSAIFAGGFLLAFGVWAMTAPRSFFDALAAFDPYNQHLLQDIGAFQIGLGAVLLIAVFDTAGDRLSTALIGVGIGSLAHTVSHIVGTDLGGSPAVDIPTFAIVGGVLLGAGIVQRKATNRGL